MANYRLSIGKYLLSILLFFVLQLCLCSQHFPFLVKAQCFLGRTKDRLYLHRMLFSGWTRLQLDSVVLIPLQTCDIKLSAWPTILDPDLSLARPKQCRKSDCCWRQVISAVWLQAIRSCSLSAASSRGLEGDGRIHWLCTLMDRGIHFCP